jgi:hypothetical protein
MHPPSILTQSQLPIGSNYNATSQASDELGKGEKTVYCVSACLPHPTRAHGHQAHSPHSSVISSKLPPKSTASQLHVQSSSEARLSFLASYAPSSSLLPNSSAAMPPFYYLRRQSLGSASSAPSSQHGVPSIYFIRTQAGLASALYRTPPISSNPFTTHQTSTTCHQPHHLHSPAKQLTSPSSL